MIVSTDNRLAAFFNLKEVKKAIRKTPKDEFCILLGHYSINQPSYEDAEDWQQDEDWRELEDVLGCSLFVSQYDDLCANPHGIETC